MAPRRVSVDSPISHPSPSPSRVHRATLSPSDSVTDPSPVTRLLIVAYAVIHLIG